MPHERGERLFHVRIDGQDLLARLGRLLVIDELFFVDRGEPFVERDALARRDGRADLPFEDAQQIAVAARAVVDAIEPLQGRRVLLVLVEDCLVPARRLAEVVELIFVDLGDAREGRPALFAAQHLGAAFEHLDERAEIARALEDALQAVGGGDVRRVLVQDLLVELAGTARLAELVLDDVGRVREEVTRDGGARRDGRAFVERLDEVRPLLRLLVDGGKARQGSVVVGVGREDGLKASRREVRSAGALRVPSPEPREERRLLFDGQIRLARVGAKRRRLGPSGEIIASEALDFVRVEVGLGVFAEGLRVGDERLRFVLELVRVDPSDLREEASFLDAARCAFGTPEEHLDELVELAERAAHLDKGVLCDVVARIELDDSPVAMRLRSPPSCAALSSLSAAFSSSGFSRSAWIRASNSSSVMVTSAAAVGPRSSDSNCSSATRASRGRAIGSLASSESTNLSSSFGIQPRGAASLGGRAPSMRWARAASTGVAAANTG